MKNTENIYDKFAELTIKLEKENRLEYLEWAARQLDEYWWDEIYRNFPEKWVQKQYKSMVKLTEKEIKKQPQDKRQMIRIVTQIATPNSQALNKVFEDFKNRSSILKYSVLVRNKKHLNLAIYLLEEDQGKETEIIEEFIKYASRHHDKNLRIDEIGDNGLGHKMYYIEENSK